MRVKVSIIIPTYNRADLLVETLDSVWAQSFRDYEVIIVDDGSTDDTRARAQKYLDKLNLRYFYKENEGRSVARNFGMKLANGEFLMFLDSDDLLLPSTLEILCRLLAACPESKVVGGYSLIFDENGRETPSNMVRLNGEFCAQNLSLEKIQHFFFAARQLFN